MTITTLKRLFGAASALAVIGALAAGCQQEPPTVVTTPGDKTIVHDNTPTRPNPTRQL